MTCFYKKNAVMICILLEDDTVILIYTIFLKFVCTCRKNTLRKNSNVTLLYKQTLRQIILLFHNIAGLDLNLEERKQLCRKVWGK